MRKLVETIYVASFDQRGSGSLRLEATKGGLILVFKEQTDPHSYDFKNNQHATGFLHRHAV